MMQNIFWKVSSASLEQESVDHLVAMIRQLNQVDVVQILWQFLARVIDKPIRIGVVALKVGMEEITVFQDVEEEYSSDQINEELVYSLR